MELAFISLEDAIAAAQHQQMARWEKWAWRHCHGRLVFNAEFRVRDVKVDASEIPILGHVEYGGSDAQNPD